MKFGNEIRQRVNFTSTALFAKKFGHVIKKFSANQSSETKERLRFFFVFMSADNALIIEANFSRRKDFTTNDAANSP